MARKGDLIVVNARQVGGPPREGKIIEVMEGELRVQYRVRWSDGHESVFAPGAGVAKIKPARDRVKISSQGTESKKSPAKASTAKKSASKRLTAKTGSKSTAKKSAARTIAAKKAGSRGLTGR